MKQDMKTMLTRLFTVAMLMMFSMAVGAEVKVELNEGYTGGKVSVKSQAGNPDGSTLVTITVTPAQGYTITHNEKKKSVIVYAVLPAEGQRNTRAPEISRELEVTGPTDKISYPNTVDYQFTVPAGLNAWVEEVKFQDSGRKSVTITYHIINMGQLDNRGQLTSNRTEALRFTSTMATVAVPDRYKSPLAKNWKYYKSDEITYNSTTKAYTFAESTTLEEDISEMNADADIYVTYELDETALSNFGVIDGGVCYIKFGNNKYLRQTTYNNQPNSNSYETLLNDGTELWKVNIKDPYQITIQSKSPNYFNWYFASTKNNFGDIRLKNSLSEAKATLVWAFALLPGADNKYRVVVADGHTQNKADYQLDQFGHGYLNNHDSGYKTRYSKYEGSNYYDCDLTFVPQANTYTYHIVDTHGDIAISYTMPEATPMGQALSSYTDIPAAIRSPYLAGETVMFYNNADCTDAHKIAETPTTGTDIYVTYTTDDLENKFLHLRGARSLNVTINGDYIYDDAGALSHLANPTENQKTTQPFLWYFSGGDPYAIEISNNKSDYKLGYTTPSSSPTPLLYATSPEKSKFIIMATSGGGEYQQMELMAATGGTTHYRVGRTDDNFSISTTETGNTSLQIKAYPNSAPVTYNLIDKAGKILAKISSKSGAVELPDEWKSPLVSEYHYWKASAFTIEGDVYTLNATPAESDKVKNVTDVTDDNIYVTYEVNNKVDFRTTDDTTESITDEDRPGSTYRLQFVNGESFHQENGKDVVMGTEQKGVYPYFCGDGMFYVYGNEQWNTQLSSGASTRSRWLWYVVSPTSDPYHVKIMSYQANAKPINTKHGYFRTFPVTYKDLSTQTNVTRYVTSLTTTAEDAGAPSPTEYMVLTGADGHCKLVTVDEIEGAPTNGSYGTRQTVKTLEQYWKNNPTVKNILGGAWVDQYETYSDNIVLTEQQEQNLPDYWHTYQTLANSAPWVGWTGDDTGTGRQYKNKNHWFQTVNMSSTEGSDGEFEFMATTLDPQVILIDNHGWEIMRKPMYDKDGNVNSELKLYDSPMVKTYHWYPKSTKVDGYHKYNVAEGDEQITIYVKNEAGKWVDGGDKTTHTSTTLFDIPYNHITPVQDNSVKTDFYVTYDVLPEYANLYRGAATEGDVTVSAFWVKQGTQYAKNEGDALATETVETDDDELKWNVKPNFNIDAEMGYKYNGAYGEKSKDETEAEYMAADKNGFDPYNIQIQSVKNPYYYFKTNTTGSHLSGGWSGTSTDLILQQMSSGIQNNVEGNDQTKLNITNATFMVVKDESGRMLLMPRFDHTTVVNSFTVPRLSAPNAATQSLELKMAPKVIHYSSEFAGMNGQYFLAEDFEFVEGFESLGSAESPFTGSIDGGLHTLKKGLEYLTTPLVAHADGAIIKNIILDEANITTGTNVGAIVANATGETRIYNCGINGGSVGGSGNVGGIVGNLHGEEITEGGKKKYVGARVINCYSYATITGGTNVGGIVGNNDYKTTASKIATMVMNCMFYGDITGGTTVSPVYGGENIANLHGGLNTYNYYAYQKLPTGHITDGKYNSALSIDDKYLNRFEFYRLLLNSNKKLAAYYASSSEETVKPSDMMKWVLETADRTIDNPKPYPVLKAQDYYPSIINYDAKHAPRNASVGRNKGVQLGTLSVTISDVGSKAPTGAAITNGSLTLTRTDKDFDRFNFNYDKIQLPYYNDVGTGNYTHNKVVTGWKITSITGGTPGTYETGDKWNGYNFADRKCTNKDLYGTGGSNRVFSQGAYFDVPYGVTAITIEPYWGDAVYVADEYLDVVYNTGYTAQSVSQLDKQFPEGTITINGSTQTVHKTISDALSGKTSSSVYDFAVVLVGNLHQSNVPSGGSVPFTVMSADLDNDNEPDNSMIYHHTGRTVICPIRFDFLNIPGTCQAQKPNGVNKILNFTIFKTKGWFETTNTCLVYSNQVEYENPDNVGGKIANSPLILLGGDFEQFVSTQKTAPSGKTNYIHVGSNVNIDNFGLGTHGDGANATPHIPVSVTGGEFKSFYLTGTYNPNAAVKKDNAECYISGGHFVEAAGACQEQIDGNVQWQIYDADIDAFFGGGINDVKPIKGTITTDIYNSHVKLFCGGPKFGDMTTGKAVTTNAEGCVFDEYFGAGYGGLSYLRLKYSDERTYDFSSTPYQTERGKYYTGAGASTAYGKKGPGVATDFDYEFFVWSSGETGSRKYVKFASFSLAQCDNVSSTLTGCTINGNYYGGGSLGKVVGTATSILDGCTVHGNVFGGGYSANIPKVPVLNEGTGFSEIPSYNSNTGMFEPGKFSGTTDYEWKHVDTLPSDGGAGFVTENGKNYVKTKADLTTLGQVAYTDLTVRNNCLVEGGVYGGGDESAVNQNTLVKIENGVAEGSQNTILNVYGGGNTADVDGNTEVHMINGTVSQDIYGGGRGETTAVGGDVTVNIGAKTGEAPSITYSGTGIVTGDVYGGSALGKVNTTADKTTTVNVYGGTVNGSVFGGGLGQVEVAADPEHSIVAKSAIVAENHGETMVNVEGGLVKTAVYGGSNVNGVLKKNSTVTLIGGTVGDLEDQDKDVVFGGGKGAPTLVNGNVTVNVGTMTPSTPPATPTYAGTATIYGHVYGGGALGNVNASRPESALVFDATKKTLVNLYQGTINGYAYGGGLGSAETAAYVGGDVVVTLDGAKVKQVFGCNNLNGTPKGKVLVHVKRTVDSAKPTEDNQSKPIGREGRTTFDVEAVYGGGNKADYIPTDALLDPTVDENKDRIKEAVAKVIIEGCEKTSIDHVYGGGNAAAVPGTNVTVKGSYIINKLYGGGNGYGEGNPGANVGIYKNGETPTDYGTGKAETKLIAGYINDVFGGSNTLGDVRVGTDVQNKKKEDGDTGDFCNALNVGNVYGAGSHADVSGDVLIVLECMPEDFVEAVYGGAEEATIDGSVTLNVTSGKFGRVFGGNNKGGNIRGSINVYVNEDGCKPLIIGELYGGGNAAPYSIYGCEKDGTTWKPKESGVPYYFGDPDDRTNIEVMVVACTSIGKVFGGGKGTTAKVIGNTRVYINTMKGIVGGVPQDDIGKIGQVFGGGGEADVIGNTCVDIGTALASEPNGVKIESGNDYLKPDKNETTSITAGVYGGGYSADVVGNTTINIGTTDLPLGVNIACDIFGGGFGQSTHVTGDVTVNIGKRTATTVDEVTTYDYEGYAQITGDVYGGSAQGKVNSYLNNSSEETASEGKTTHVNFYGGTITGNIHGGGLGDLASLGTGHADVAADVYGPVTVTMEEGSSTNTVVNNVFGCNNYNGSPKNSVTVNINGGIVNHSVYGGGNQAAYTPTESTSNYPAVNINNGTIEENVFGGGLGETATATSNPHVTIGDNVEGHVVAIKKSVYGGGSLATVDGSTNIVVNSGTIGTPKEGETVYGGPVYGNIYGGGYGSNNNVRIGLVKGNTNVTVNGGNILHNIYGGGAYGSVGTYTYASEDANAAITALATENTGKATIRIIGGTIGTNGHENGMIFGASRGDIAAPDAIQDNMAWVYDTDVIIGTEGDGKNVSTPSIRGSVYGSGENGHTFHDAKVTIYSGMVGITDTSIDGGASYGFRGNVYGGGCGTDKYYSGAIPDGHTEHDGHGDKYNIKAGIVVGTSTVTINGGHVVRNVYGGGAMGSVTVGTIVNISGNSIIGAENSGGGYIYAASRGNDDMDDGYATVGSTELNISGGTVWGSAFGGGQLGTVKGSVAVNVSGGVVKNDVYGGGALANTNTDNWDAAAGTWSITSTDDYYVEVKHLKRYDPDEVDPVKRAADLAAASSVGGYYERSGDSPNYTYTETSDTKAIKSKTYYKLLDDFLTVAANGTAKTTTVSLTGGTIGNAYGGGLGQLAKSAVYYTAEDAEVIAGTKNVGDVKTPAVTAVEAMVYGDISVTVNGTKFTKETERVDGKAIPVTGRVFGCNNLNGTPKGSVLVHVISTHRLDDGAHVKNQFEIQGVYGGGNMSHYVPKTYDNATEFGQHTKVIVDGCDETSIERVYGGGNASDVPFTDVTIEGAFQIGYVFGGGNGGDKINKDGAWINNPGANVLPGYTNVVLHGGTIGEAFGGSDSKGTVGGSELTQDEKPGCKLVTQNIYGASKEAETDNDVILNLYGCANSVVDKVFGGSYNADVRGNITINIYNGIYTSIFGGNDRQGTIGGNITINVEEVDECMPIIIQNLVGGGSQADYPGVDSDGNPAKAYKGAPYERGYAEHPDSYEDFTSGNITINVKAATRIDRIFGGCDNARATGTTTVNVNMVKGSKAGDEYALPAGYTGNAIPNLVEGRIKDEIGTIGYVYGGGNEGDVVGNSIVNIGTEKDIVFTNTPEHLPNHLTPNEGGKYDVLGAHIYGDVYGGGNAGNVSGNATVNICTADYSETTGFEGVFIDKTSDGGGSVYGGGSEADVLGNTNVTMAGGYVYDGVYGGGLKGSVGTYTRDKTVTTESNNFEHSTHADVCLGKPTACTAGGTCTVVVSGGQVGPVEVATKGMKNEGGDGPVDVGFVFGAGRGEVENPNDDKDADFHTYVDKTDVTISGGLIMASVYGGGENGRVLHDTHVTISGGQIGCGEAPGNVPKIYTEDEWTSENAATFKECLSWDYGKDTNGDGKKDEFLPYDPYAQTGDTEDAKVGTDGHTYYGSVFGGGSGYFPYEIKNIQGTVTGHEWLRSAGAVYGNTVIDITGGHILTCVYGGNETTDVGTYTNNDKGQPLVHESGGKCTINMTGGTIGVPRTVQQMKDHPVTCYLFGAGKGDQRTHFNTWTNVQETEVNVSGTARIFGSVFGGGEDGHVLGNAAVNIGDVTIDATSYDGANVKIGTTGTSYVDGNVFGGGRGFSGVALTAGSTGGNTAVNISDGIMLGSIYGGGRLASVGIDFTPADDPLYGQLVDDTSGSGVTHGHITVNISGGTIGNDVADALYGGNVFGAGMGRNTKLNGELNELWPKVATSKVTNVNITGGTIKKNVYGGGEFGVVRNRAYVTIGGIRNESTGDITSSGNPTIYGSVFGAGKGSDDYQHKTPIKVGGYSEQEYQYYSFTPMLWNGVVAGNTYVNVVGGTIMKSVYGGGELASVGLIDFISDKDGNFTNMPKHESKTTDEKTFYDFGLSWPYEFTYHAAAPLDDPAVGGGVKGGITTVNITGNATIKEYVYGGGKGQVAFDDVNDIEGQRYIEAFCANARITNVTIGTEGGSDDTPTIGTETTGSIYGGGEDGHVYENANVTIHHGTITHTVFGGGKGTSTYMATLLDPSTGNSKESQEAIHSWTAGKVYGNTNVTINGGSIGWFVYGGGNMASVGKGNYTGGSDDYSTGGYGELPSADDGAIWTATPAANSYADYFQNSGIAIVNILGGTIGTATAGFNDDGIPYGSVFGGSRGTVTMDVDDKSPRYKYVPDFYLGYVNKAIINVGGTTETGAVAGYGPTIYGSIYGGAQDGHVRNSTEVKIFKGSVAGQTSDAAGRSGHVFGAGSGIGTYTDPSDSKKKISSSSGSVSCTTLVELNGGSISGNIYGGGAMASVGPPKIGDKNEQHAASDSHKSFSKTQVDIKGGSVGGSVYGASRGPGDDYYKSQFTDLGVTYDKTKFATDIWSDVTVSGGTIGDNVYGGGQGGIVKESTTVSLTGGDIAHDAYGGGQGTANIAADVLGNTTTELNKGKGANDSGCMVERVFGCNDLNGTPKGHVLVHVYATQHKGTDKIVPDGGKYAKFKSMEGGYTITNYTDNTEPDDLKKLATTVGLTSGEITTYENAISGGADEAAKKAALGTYIEAIADKKYDVLAVYGGGDLAMYEPTDPNEATDVIIDGCDLTSIKQVYGGGNAASTPANQVRINAAYEIHEAFGGGNGKDAYEKGGKWYENLGANVGYKATYHSDTSDNEKGTQGNPYPAVANEDADTPEERRANTSYHYGKGTANLIITGGRVHTTYGGSNTKGNVRAEVHTSTEDAGVCTMLIDKSYPAGKNADTDAGSKVEAKCVDYQAAIYGGAMNANVYSDVVIDITNGTYGKIYGGNDRSGQIYGSITINVHEEGCKPIIIGELYGGGYNAEYSIYGFKDDGSARTQAEYEALSAVEKAKITVQRDPQINIISATKIGKIYGGGYQAKVVGSPSVNVNMENGYVAAKYVTESSSDFTQGDHHVIDTEHDNIDRSYYVEKLEDGKAILRIGTIGTIYGGGYKGDVQGNTSVAIGTGEWLSQSGQRETTDADGKVYTYNSTTKEWEWTQKVGETTTSGTVADQPVPGRNAATITGNVFGGGEGEALNSGDRAFYCESAMVGVDGDGLTNPAGGTSVVIANGTVGTLDNNNKLVENTGNVYGGGEIGRVEKNTVVTIGVTPKEGETITNTKFKPTIYGSVFGAGKGVDTHGYSALVRGNSTVTIQGFAKVGESVYGGGEIASVGRYKVKKAQGDPADAPDDLPIGQPYSLKNENSGNCVVTVLDNAEIGPNNMTMFHVDNDGNIVANDKPDNSGHVFGAGKGAMPGIYTFSGNSYPYHMTLNANGNSVWETITTEEAYLRFIETLGLATQTDVTIGGKAFVKGDIFGGAEQGFVQHDTHVTIEGDCQIGNGYVQMNADGEYLARTARYSLNRRYTATEWAEGHLEGVAGYANSLPECASWEYGQATGDAKYAPHDVYANSYDSKGGKTIADNGSTFYGNVFGGGSGYFPYKAGTWHWKAGDVGGNTVVDIKGGHVLTNVYGANELTNVVGKSTVNMSGGTIGVPRTLGQIAAHPVTCYLFGGGKGDPRVLFNKQTNVNDVEVNVTGGWIYGSAFGGGEDGHVMRDVTMTISDNAKIGTWGTSYVDGNVFGGGRGFAGDAYTAGNVAGSVTLNISGGTMLGSIYGGGRLGSVGYGLYEATETEDATGHKMYGEMQDDGYGDWYKNESDEYVRDAIDGFKRGYVEITISGGTIGNDYEFQDVPTNITTDGLAAWKTTNHVPNTTYETTSKTTGETTTYTHRLLHTKGGNVYAGGMGRREQLDGKSVITAVDWHKLGNVKSTKLTITGGTIKSNVYGGGEFGAVQGTHTTAEKQWGTEINITGGTIGTEIVDETAEGKPVMYTFGSVYGGGTGTIVDVESNISTPVSDVNKLSAYVANNAKVAVTDAIVRASVYGGGELGAVGGNTDVTISGTTKIGRDEVKPATDADAGYVMFGGWRMGNVYGGGRGSEQSTIAGLVKGNTNVTISGGNVYHNVYGGGALASVGDFKISTGKDDDPSHLFIPFAGVPWDWTKNTGTATVTITGGTIGISGRDNGLVFGSSRGDISEPVDVGDDYLTDPYDRVAWVNKSVVTIGTSGSGTTLNTPLIKGSVYGGGENGHNDESATVNVYSGTIGVTDTEDPWYSFTDKVLEKDVQLYRGNVYGAGSGSDTYKDNQGKEHWNPKSGMVGGNTFVNIYGGHIGRSVYGGGAMASVGTITNNGTMETTDKHASENNSFALSWPYKFVFAPNTGKATVNVTGGHIGTRQLDGGDVYGSSRGLAGDRYEMAHLAFTNETEVNINYTSPYKLGENDTEETIQNDFSTQCITGSVHGSGENGYVYGDTHVTLDKGLIGHSLYGAGKGNGTYTKALNKIGGGGTYDAKIYSLIAGKVMGNTVVTMNGGHVMRNVYGGGNMGSVGKGNYAGGTDDYYPAGYGEKIEGKLWTSAFNPEEAISESNKPDDAYYFLSSGKATVKVLGGIVGYINKEDPTASTKGLLPYGNVFGGSAGEAAPNIANDPRYEYSPAFFSGYVNETDVTIGTSGQETDADAGQTGKAPRILSSVYGGGQDGHVRRDAKVTVYSGEIGMPFTEANKTLLKTTSSNIDEVLNSPQWMHRGNIYGGGSGITEYHYDYNYDGDTEDENEQGFSNSSGSVTRFTEVNVKGGIIHRNVYGGGSMGSVGAPKIDQEYEPYKPGQPNIDGKPENGPGRQSMNTVNIGGGSSVVTIGTPFINGWTYNKLYGGEVYGACRGLSTLNSEEFSTSIWTQVNIYDKATIMGNVYGGGDNGMVKKDTDVKIGE